MFLVLLDLGNSQVLLESLETVHVHLHVVLQVLLVLGSFVYVVHIWGLILLKGVVLEIVSNIRLLELFSNLEVEPFLRLLTVLRVKCSKLAHGLKVGSEGTVWVVWELSLILWVLMLFWVHLLWLARKLISVALSILEAAKLIHQVLDLGFSQVLIRGFSILRRVQIFLNWVVV